MGIIFELLKAILYGITEGITEWLPVGSFTHLKLISLVFPQALYGASEQASFSALFLNVIRLAAVLAVVPFWIGRMNPFVSDSRERRKAGHTWLVVLCALVPAMISKVILFDMIAERITGILIPAVLLPVIGVFILLAGSIFRNPPVRTLGKIPVGAALICGAVQIFALVPGISHPAAGITAALALGFTPLCAAEFTILYLLPLQVYACIRGIIGVSAGLNGIAVITLGLGALSSFILSVYTAGSFLDYLEDHDMKLFGIYRILFGAAVLALLFMKLLPAGGM